MRFKVTQGYSAGERTERDVVYLTLTGWDDWFKYSTQYAVEYVDPRGERRSIGYTKVGRFGLLPANARGDIPLGARYPNPPTEFDSIGNDYFSLGQDPSFYEVLTSYGNTFRERVLRSLRDIAYDPELLERAILEDVTRVSLLRTVPLPTVRDQFQRLAHGGARLTPYNFSYSLTYTKMDPAPRIGFDVTPGAIPPTNIHVLIGRNGVGKSTFLNNLASHLVGRAATNERNPERETDLDDRAQISNLVSVSFSAFDAFEPLTEPRDRTKGLNYHYVGLKKKRSRSDEPDAIKGPQALATEMTLSGRICFQGARRTRWQKGLRILESDPIFAAAGIADVVENVDNEEEVLEYIGGMFRLLSSGHKIVLLTITKLVETVEEKSLVLLDEPEAHLHPPLLSAFVRALSDLLVDRNGVAIVATHSPVVLQEVPRSCVWKINRVGTNVTVERPSLETFGENVGTLTNEVFGLEVTATGFHRMLEESAHQHGDYDSALASFDGQLGAEGRAILRSMINSLNSSWNVAH